MNIREANGLHLHYDERGPSDGPALVFANSLGTDFRIWDRLAAAFEGRFRVVVYDKRGHGLSDAPDAPYRMDDHVADLAALLDGLGVADAIVCGVSVGGMIAQGLAAARPDLVRALVLCDTGHVIGTKDSWDDRIAAIREGGIAVLAEAILERWFSASFRAERPAELAGWRHMLTRTPLEGYAGTCAAIRDADLTEGARSLAMPTLCVCGSEDGATPPELVQSLAALIPGARYAPVEGAGHLPCIEAPEALAGLMNDFFKEADLV